MRLNRRGLIGLGGLVAIPSLAGCQDQAGAGKPMPAGHGPAETASAEVPVSPTEALERLRAGNDRFRAGRADHPRQDTAARADVAEHQHPWALVHGCVDSRVAPELVFDQGVGDLFTTRTAGAVLDDTLVGSMEFAVGSPYEVPVLVILGHTGCGAVTATVDALAASPSRPSAPGEVIDIVREIAPAARGVAPDDDKAAYVDAVVRAHTVSVAEALVRRSAIIREAVNAGRTRAVPAVYDLGTGRVEWLA